jgi:uncharacterized heparinase superfamily protein
VAQLQHAIVRRPAIATELGAPDLAGIGTPVPFLPPGRHARCRRSPGATNIDLLNREVGFRNDVDWSFHGEGPLWAYHLHQFDHLRDPALAPKDRSALILDWIENHASGIGWDPHPTSHRILSWGKLLLTSGALEIGSADHESMRRSLASQIETLSRNIEVRLQANHLFTNLLALLFGGLLFEGREADRWLGFSDRFRAELRDQVHPDGAHEERSPLYHSLLLEQVLDLLNLARVSSRAPDGLAEALCDTASRMCGALEVWTHPDGEIALFSDAAFGIASPPAALADYATLLNVPVLSPEQPNLLGRGGFVRLADGRFQLIASVGGPAPEHQPGHAHCDALAFELSVNGERVVTDTGVFAYVPGPDRQTARATRSHATVEVDGHDQAELWAAHRVGGRPDVAIIDYGPDRFCEATCAGWATREIVHRRRLELEDGILRIRDTIEGGPRPVRLTLPLAPGLRARLVGDAASPRELRVVLASGAELRVRLPSLEEGAEKGAEEVIWRLDWGDYFPEFGRRERRWILTGESASFRSGTWRFEL